MPPQADKRQSLPPTAFDYLPKVDPVAPWKDVAGKATCKQLDYRFNAPAHFPVPQFGSEPAEALESSALVIYEGMQLLLFADGRFEVAFTATTPDIPVTLRLQFVVYAHAGLPFTITLPPIPIDTEITAQGNYRGRTVQVRHVGNSHMLRAASDAYHGQVPPLLIIRQGVARFGTLPVTN